MIFSSKDDVPFVVSVGNSQFSMLSFNTEGEFTSRADFLVGQCMSKVTIRPYLHDGRILFPIHECGDLRVISKTRVGVDAPFQYKFTGAK